MWKNNFWKNNWNALKSTATRESNTKQTMRWNQQTGGWNELAVQKWDENVRFSDKRHFNRQRFSPITNIRFTLHPKKRLWLCNSTNNLCTILALANRVQAIVIYRSLRWKINILLFIDVYLYFGAFVSWALVDVFACCCFCYCCLLIVFFFKWATHINRQQWRQPHRMETGNRNVWRAKKFALQFRYGFCALTKLCVRLKWSILVVNAWWPFAKWIDGVFKWNPS